MLLTHETVSSYSVIMRGQRKPTMLLHNLFGGINFYLSLLMNFLLKCENEEKIENKRNLEEVGHWLI